MRRPRPISTLFPYTTLFRSGVEVDLSRSQLDAPDDRVERIDLSRRTHEDGSSPSSTSDVTPHVASVILARADPGIDRKSTRLNSCHEWISYAVFCLKKKRIT